MSNVIRICYGYTTGKCTFRARTLVSVCVCVLLRARSNSECLCELYEQLEKTSSRRALKSMIPKYDGCKFEFDNHINIFLEYIHKILKVSVVFFRRQWPLEHGPR